MNRAGSGSALRDEATVRDDSRLQAETT